MQFLAYRRWQANLLTSAGKMKEEILRSILTEIARWVYKQSGIEIPENLISLDPHRSLSTQAKLSYRGSLKQPVPYPSIKLDLTANEQIVLEPEMSFAFFQLIPIIINNVHLDCVKAPNARYL